MMARGLPLTVTRRGLGKAEVNLFAVIAVCLSGICAPCLAAAQTGPAETITAVYKRYQKQRDAKLPRDAYSTRMKNLIDADRKRTPKGDVGRLDFDPVVNGQDWEIKSLAVSATETNGERVTVRATFTNFDQPQEIVFSVMRVSQRWVIDDISSLKKPRWTLSKILVGAPDAFIDGR